MKRSDAGCSDYFAFLVAPLVLFTPTMLQTAQSASAAEVKRECTDVRNLATITHSTKLSVSIISDNEEQYCHFFVSMPPPFAMNSSIDAWYKSGKDAASDDQLAAQLIYDIAYSTISKVSARHTESVGNQIKKNSSLIGKCILSLFKKQEITLKSGDARFYCSVPDTTEYVAFAISAEKGFANIIILPRPS